MARRPDPPPVRPRLTVPDMQRCIVRFRRRIDELKALDFSNVTERFSSPEVKTIQIAIDEALSAAFGKGTPEYNRYVSAKQLDSGPISMGSDWLGRRSARDEAHEAQEYLSKGRVQSIALLEQAIRSLEEEIELEGGPTNTESDAPRHVEISERIFVVHGHDVGARESVARFLGTLGLQAIILNEQPNEGRTLIEKFERHADVGFAVVLLTPDDTIAPTSPSVPPLKQARQNVVLELGYFIGKLGRNKVCALKREGVTLPSDIIGVAYTPFDSSDAWKLQLARELRAAGYKIDMNKVV